MLQAGHLSESLLTKLDSISGLYDTRVKSQDKSLFPITAILHLLNNSNSNFLFLNYMEAAQEFINWLAPIDLELDSLAFEFSQFVVPRLIGSYHINELAKHIAKANRKDSTEYRLLIIKAIMFHLVRAY